MQGKSGSSLAGDAPTRLGCWSTVAQIRDRPVLPAIGSGGEQRVAQKGSGSERGGVREGSGDHRQSRPAEVRRGGKAAGVPDRPRVARIGTGPGEDPPSSAMPLGVDPRPSREILGGKQGRARPAAAATPGGGRSARRLGPVAGRGYTGPVRTGGARRQGRRTWHVRTGRRAIRPPVRSCWSRDRWTRRAWSIGWPAASGRTCSGTPSVAAATPPTPRTRSRTRWPPPCATSAASGARPPCAPGCCGW